MRPNRTAAVLTAAALLVNTTAPAAFAFDRFIQEDEMVMRFEGKTPGKVENLRWDRNGVRLLSRPALVATSLSLLMLASTANAFGVGFLPFRGIGVFELAMTLGFLGSVGLGPNSLVALEADIPADSNPLKFFLVQAKPVGDDLQVSASSDAGPLGAPVTVPNTRLVRLRIRQTPTQLIFDVRNMREADPWVNVATIARAVTADVVQLSFGSAFLNAGATAVFDDLRASGDIFGPAEAFHLGILYAYIANLVTARDALIHDGDAALALATVAAFQTALLLTLAGIELDLSQGDFLAFTLIALALKHLKSAGREAAKVEKAVTRGENVDALGRLARAVGFLQLATLAMRGIGARKIDELPFFFDDTFDKASLALTAAAR